MQKKHYERIFVGITVSLFAMCSVAMAADNKVVVVPLFSSANNTGCIHCSENGNVGIGTTNPSKLLTVENDVNDDVQMSVRNLNPGSQAVAMVTVGNDTTDQMVMAISSTGYTGPYVPANAGGIRTDSTITGGLWVITGATAPIMFSTQDTERMRIDANGNVGIGTKNPVSKFAVNGLPTAPPDGSGNAGVVCVTNNGNFWLDNDGTTDCL